MSRTRFQVVQSLHLRISPQPYTESDLLVASRTPPSAAATMGSIPYDSGPPTGSSLRRTTLFSVLCLHSFKSSEYGMLSFEKNDVLDILKCVDSGWWAAALDDGMIVGWIPESYVVEVSDELAAKLRNIDPGMRQAEYEAEVLYESAPVAHLTDLFDDDFTLSSPFDDENNVVNVGCPKTEVSPQLLTDVDQPVSPRSPSFITQDPCQYVRRQDQFANETWSETPRERPRAPPSPKPPVPFPTGVTQQKSLKHSFSSPDGGITRMKPMSINRNSSMRPKPVMVDDNSALRRLSTFIEAGNKKDVRKLIIPDISGSFDGLRGRELRGPNRKDSANGTTPGLSAASLLMNTVIDIKPSYLQLQYLDQIDEDGKGHIRTATFPALIERLTTNMPFANLSTLASTSTFTNVFLTTFRTFSTAAQLFDILVERFNARPPKPLEPEEYQDWVINMAIPTQRRVLEVFSIWLLEHRLLEEEPYIAQRLTQFLNTITTPPHNITAHRLIKSIERLTFAVPQQSICAVSPKKARKQKPHKNELLRLDAHDLAEQLTLLEFGLYAKVTPQTCLSYAKTPSGDTVAKLLDFCATHDKLGSWVKSSILNQDVLGKRSDTVDFWIKVAEKCRLLHNIDAMSSIIIALSSTVITRLRLTWAHVSRRSILDALLRFNDPKGSFSAYRILMQSAEGHCIPFIGMYLTDLVHVSDQHSNADVGDKICFYKRARWYEITNNILKFQNRPYNIAMVEQTTKFIEQHLKENTDRNQEWFWSKSQEVQNTEMVGADIRKGLEEAGF